MGPRRMGALAAAVIVCFLVAMAGRSCAKDIDAKNKANRKSSNSNTASDFEIVYPGGSKSDSVKYKDDSADRGESDDSGKVKYDEFGRPIQNDPFATEPEPTTEGEDGGSGEAGENEEPTTQPPDNGGGNGLPDFGGFGDMPDLFGHGNDDEPPPAISGFNHGEWDEDGNLKPTLPPGFAIEIG